MLKSLLDNNDESSEDADQAPSTFRYCKYGHDPNAPKAASTSSTKQDLARQRWKILCLVRTADAETDEITRQERLKERVDDWLAGFVSRLRLEEERKRKAAAAAAEQRRQQRKASSANNSNRDSGLDLSSGLDFDEASEVQRVLSDAKSEIRRSRTKERRRLEQEQRKRIRQRERDERDRERNLVLEGKIAASKVHLKDPMIRVQRDLLSVDRRIYKARSVSPSPRAKSKSPRPKRKTSSSSTTRKATSTKTKNAVKVKWKSSDEKKVSRTATETSLDLLDLHTLVEDCTETVIANLVYDERKDELTAQQRGGESDKASEATSHANPVFSAFEKAKGVDDLYRIAEIYVDPAQIYSDL